MPPLRGVLNGRLLRAPALDGLSGIQHAFSLSLRSAADQGAFAEAAELSSLRLLRVAQVHGRGVVDAAEALLTERSLEGDALVSDRPGVALAVASADCVPVLLADPVARVVAAVHAGWRGMRARVIPSALAGMARLGARPDRVRAAIGPSVHAACYEVGPEVREAFERAFDDVSDLFTGRRLDLVRSAFRELGEGGVAADRVSVIPLCTHCQPELASFRREGSGRGTNLAAIALL